MNARSDRVVRALCAAVLLCLSTTVLHAQMPAPPVSSESLVHLGGYGGVVLGSAPATARSKYELSQSVIAALLSGTLLPRVTYFAEVEAASRSRENWTGDPENDAVEIERLYGELHVSDALRLRAGRFLTPVGQWNEIHADPLTLTPQRPLTTYRPFAKSTTGVLIAGQLHIGSRDAGYALYGTPNRLEHDREESSFARALGGRLAIEVLPSVTLGGSFTQFRASRPVVTDDDREPEAEDSTDDEVGGVADDDFEEREEDSRSRQLFGADLRLDTRWLNLHIEATTLSATQNLPRENGGFVQAGVPVVDGLTAVARAEYYEPVVSTALRIGTVGLVYRPVPKLSVKIAHQWTSRVSLRVPAGWFVSVSGLL